MEPTQNTIKQQDVSPHILHPDSEEISTPITQEQVSELAHKLEQGTVPSYQLILRKVLRKKDFVNAQVMQRARALAAATLVGVGATSASDAVAGPKINGGERLLAGLVTTAIANSELGRQIPVNITVRPDGNIDLNGKSPQQLAYGFKINYAGDTETYLNRIGIKIDEDGAVVVIKNINNLNQQIPFTKYYHDKHFTYNVVAKRVENGAVQFNINYIQDGRNRTEKLTIGMLPDGNMWSNRVVSQ